MTTEAMILDRLVSEAGLNGFLRVENNRLLETISASEKKVEQCKTVNDSLGKSCAALEARIRAFQTAIQKMRDDTGLVERESDERLRIIERLVNASKNRRRNSKEWAGALSAARCHVLDQIMF